MHADRALKFDRDVALERTGHRRRPPGPTPDGAPANDPHTAARRGFVCASCAAWLAGEDDVVAIGGKTHHERVNPGAFVHRFVTLRRCDAARTNGTPTAEFTWFAGYAWQIVTCARCTVHLGWRFASVLDHVLSEFFGVLDARLRSA